MNKLRSLLVSALLAFGVLFAVGAAPVYASCSGGYLDIYEDFNLNNVTGAALRVCYGSSLPKLNQVQADEVCGFFFHRQWDNCISSVQLVSIGTTKTVCLWTAQNYTGNGLQIFGNWSGNFDGGLAWMNDNAESIQWNC